MHVEDVKSLITAKKESVQKAPKMQNHQKNFNSNSKCFSFTAGKSCQTEKKINIPFSKIKRKINKIETPKICV